MEQQDRYCRNCGQELKPEDRFCAGCGRSIYEAAYVPTPEADVPVPPVQAPSQPQQGPQHSGARDAATRGPKLAMLAVFLVLLVGRTAMEMPPPSAGTFGFRLGFGMGIPIVIALLLAGLLLLIGGVYYATARKDGVTFGEAIFNWPMVILAGGVVFLTII
jgi:hypothetical protein